VLCVVRFACPDECGDRPPGKDENLSTAPPPGYHSPQQLESSFLELQTLRPDLALLIDIQSEFGAPPTYEGRSIKMLKISDNVQADEDEPNVLLISNHHARELITPEIALNLSRTLVLGYDSNPDYRDIINRYQIFVVWTANPDGLDYVWNVNTGWRKNRRPNNGGAYGVDLNRNYPFGWDFSCGGDNTPSSDTYRGPSAASEPEVQSIIKLHTIFNFAKVFDFHSYGRDVRQNYAACAALPTAIDSYFGEICAKLAASSSYIQSRSCCTGGQIAYGYHSNGGISYLTETGTAFQPPANQMQEELVRVLPMTILYLQLPVPVTGHVIDASNGDRLAANLDIRSIGFNFRETFKSYLPHGRFHIWLPPGAWTVTFYASGYQNSTVSVRSPEANDIIVNLVK